MMRSHQGYSFPETGRGLRHWTEFFYIINSENSFDVMNYIAFPINNSTRLT